MHQHRNVAIWFLELFPMFRNKFTIHYGVALLLGIIIALLGNINIITTWQYFPLLAAVPLLCSTILFVRENATT